MLTVFILLRRALLTVPIRVVIVLKSRQQGLRLSFRNLLRETLLVFLRNISRAHHRLNACFCCFSRINSQTDITGAPFMLTCSVAGYIRTWFRTLLCLCLHYRIVAWWLLVGDHTGVLFFTFKLLDYSDTVVYPENYFCGRENEGLFLESNLSLIATNNLHSEKLWDFSI